MPPCRFLLPLTNKTLVFVGLLLLLLVGHALFLDAGNRAAAQASGGVNAQANDDIEIVLTTYENGQVLSRVVGRTSYLNATARKNSSDASTPLQPAAAGDLVLSQIYSGGGEPGATYQNDYIEIFNRTNSNVNFSGWRIHLASATGSFDQAFSFENSGGINIPARKYLLIRLGPNSANGAQVPSDLATNPIALSC